jgi:phage gp36-like protein
VPRLTQADLERAVGGADALVQLLDFDDDGAADTAMVSDILEEIDAEANSYIQIRIDLSSPQLVDAPLLLMKERACGAYLCWLRGTRAQAMPDMVRQAREDAIRWYEDVGAGRATIGTVSKPASDLQVTQVERSTDALPRVTWSTLRGFVW